ncbi:unnamed protein product [Pleuronectes platessa]|uniref:Uncharacterized protein n=1 Tax=Pleuronectes platessa TaxID=8262 RepID=A0A9N7Z256_PLEPL|nr:unnamed protein product [Pleuronectes platessa]
MFPLRMVIVGFLYCCIRTGLMQSHTKALFPAASRTKRGAAGEVNPTFCNSSEDVNLLFEILLTGIHFQASGEFSVRDAELASLRKTQHLEVICEEIIPRKLTDIFRLISGLSDHTAARRLGRDFRQPLQSHQAGSDRDIVSGHSVCSLAPGGDHRTD